MSFGYSGSIAISRGVPKVFADDTYYSFRINEFCRIGVDGNPLVEFKEGEEFIIKVGATYIFDRNTKISLSYLDTTVAETPLSTTSTTWFVDVSNPTSTVYKMLDLYSDYDGRYTFMVNISIPSYTTLSATGEVRGFMKLELLSATTPTLHDYFAVYSSATTETVTLSQMSFIVGANTAIGDIFVVKAYANRYHAMGVNATYTGGALNTIKVTKLPYSDSYQYAWNLRYNHPAVSTIDTTTNDATPYGMFISNLSGLKLFIVGDGGNAVDMYTMTTAKDTSTATYTGTYAIAEDTVPTDVFFNDTATMMFVTGSTNDSIYTYTLTTPDVVTSGVSYVRAYSFASQDTNVKSACFSSDGLRLWMAGATNNKVFEYVLTTAYDTTTMTYTGNSITLDGGALNVRVSSDSKYLYAMSKTTSPTITLITQYTINGSISSYSNEYYHMRLNMFSETTYQGFDISSDGKKLYTIGSTDEIVREIQIGY